MHPRSRIRGRETPLPPPSPRNHHRRARDSPQRSRISERPPPPSPLKRRSPERPPPPSPLQRRSPDRLPPRRLLLDDKPPPPPLAVPSGERRWRADILLEAGRLAAQYLVAQGILPEHVLHAREDPSPNANHVNANANHSPSPRSLAEVPAPAPTGGYARKRDDEPYPDEDPKLPRRNGRGVGGGGGDWCREKREEDEMLARARSGWDRRSQSFDGRRNGFNNGGAAGGGCGGGGDWGRDKRDDIGDRLADRGCGRRSNECDEKRRPAMSRSYSQNDRRASSDDRRPSVDDRRPSGDDRRTSADDRRPSADDCRPSVDDRRPSGDDRRTSADDRRPSADDCRPSVDDRRTSAVDRRPYVDDRRPSADDRRPSVDLRLDRRRKSRSRSRSRSRTRPRNSYSGGRRDSDWRAPNGALDQSKVAEYRTVAGVDRDDVDHVPRELKGPRSMVVMKADDGASHEYEEVVVMETDDDGASHEEEEGMVSDDHGEDDGASYEYEEVVESEEDEEMAESVDHGQGVRRDEDGAAAGAAGLNDADGAGEINASNQLFILDVHPSEPVEELVHMLEVPVEMQSQLSDVKKDTEAGIGSRDACLIESVAESSGCSEVRGEMEAPQIELETETLEEIPQSELETELHEGIPQDELEAVAGDATRDEVELPALETEILEEIPQSELETEVHEEIPENELVTDAGDPNRDEEELPAWFGIFDINVTGAHESCGISEIPGDPPEDHALDSLPDLVGQTSQQVYYDTVETQGQEEVADDNHQLEEDGQVLLNQGSGTNDSNKNDLNNEQMLIDQSADERGPGDEQLEDEQMFVNNEEILLKQDAEEHVDHNHQIENEQMLVNNEETLLNQDAELHVDQNHQMENEQMLLNEGTAVQVLDNYQANSEQLLPDHATDELPDVNQEVKNERMLVDHVTVTSVHDLDDGHLNSEQMLQSIGADKPAADPGLLKDGKLHLDQATDGHATFHSLGNGHTIPVINLEDDDEEQSDTGEILDPKIDALHKDNVLAEHVCSRDEKASRFS